MRSAVIVFPGINRERDMARALDLASGQASIMVWHKETALPPVDVIVLPGGFSYGDYLRCGAIAARSPIMADVAKKAADGPDLHLERSGRPERQRRMTVAGDFASRCKGGFAAGGKSPATGIACPARLTPLSPSRKAVGVASSCRR
jgi:hypothetical protein